MKQAGKRQIKLNIRLLPVMVGLLFLMQVTFPYKGWIMLLVGLGGLWLVAYFWVYVLADGLHLTREMRFGWAHVGDRLEERFTLTNTGPFPALWVEIEDHSTLPGYSASRVTGVETSGKNRWYTKGACQRRGIFTLGPTTLRTGDPFGIYTLTLHYAESSPLTVTPPIVPLPAIEVAPGGQAGEGRSRPNAFERTVSSTGVRPYVPGDNLNWIHWPTTARQEEMFVRLFDSTPAGDWWLILDLDQQIQTGQGFDSTQEHAIVLAASLADRGLRLGRAVGLITHGQDLAWLPPQMGDFQSRQILRALALAEPGPYSLSHLLTRTQAALDQFTSLIVITVATPHSAWIEALLPLLQRGAVATVLLLDPVSFGGDGNTDGTLAVLNNLGVTSYIITRDLLDQPEARPGQQGHWQWRISPSGRAIPANKAQDTRWKELI